MNDLDKKYRFYYHFYRQKGKMSVHFQGKCNIVQDVECRVPTETKWYQIQPRLRLQGFCKEIIFENDKAIII